MFFSTNHYRVFDNYQQVTQEFNQSRTTSTEFGGTYNWKLFSKISFCSALFIDLLESLCSLFNRPQNFDLFSLLQNVFANNQDARGYHKQNRKQPCRNPGKNPTHERKHQKLQRNQTRGKNSLNEVSETMFDEHFFYMMI